MRLHGTRAEAGAGRADCGALGGPALAALVRAAAAVGPRARGPQQGRTLATPLRVTHLSVQETLAESKQATKPWQVTQHASRDSWKGWGRGRGLEVEACPFVGPTLLQTCLWSLRKQERSAGLRQVCPSPS